MPSSSSSSSSSRPRVFSGLTSFCKTGNHLQLGIGGNEPSGRVRRNCCGRPKHGSFWHDITALTLIDGVQNQWSCLMFTDSYQKLQIGDVELVGRMEIGRREQCADNVERQHHIEFVQLQSRRMRKRKRSMPRRAPTVAISRRLRSWRSSSRRRRMKTNDWQQE